jgi:hypothetical protein
MARPSHGSAPAWPAPPQSTATSVAPRCGLRELYAPARARRAYGFSRRFEASHGSACRPRPEPCLSPGSDLRAPRARRNGRALPRTAVSLVGRASSVAPSSSVATRANRSGTRPGTRAFRGINGRLPAPAFAGASAFSGPFHLFHGALAPVRRRAAIGVARRPTNAGQEPAHQSQRRGTSRATNGSLGNWSRGGQLTKAWKACVSLERLQAPQAHGAAGTRGSRGPVCRPDFGGSPGRICCGVARAADS